MIGWIFRKLTGRPGEFRLDLPGGLGREESQTMKTAIAALMLLGASLHFSHADDAVSIGEFRYQGKNIQQATAKLRSSDSVFVTGNGGSVTVPWKDVSATAQFKLKAAREQLIAAEAKQGEAADAIKARIAKGEYEVQGVVNGVYPDGCVVLCDPVPVPYTGLVGSLTRVGGSLAPASTPSRPILPRASGQVFVRGIKGLADGERADLTAIRSDETFKDGMLTLRVYDTQVRK